MNLVCCLLVPAALVLILLALWVTVEATTRLLQLIREQKAEPATTCSGLGGPIGAEPQIKEGGPVDQDAIDRENKRLTRKLNGDL